MAKLNFQQFVEENEDSEEREAREATTTQAQRRRGRSRPDLSDRERWSASQPNTARSRGTTTDRISRGLDFQQFVESEPEDGNPALMAVEDFGRGLAEGATNTAANAGRAIENAGIAIDPMSYAQLEFDSEIPGLPTGINLTRPKFRPWHNVDFTNREGLATDLGRAAGDEAVYGLLGGPVASVAGGTRLVAQGAKQAVNPVSRGIYGLLQQAGRTGPLTLGAVEAGEGVAVGAAAEGGRRAEQALTGTDSGAGTALGAFGGVGATMPLRTLSGLIKATPTAQIVGRGLRALGDQVTPFRAAAQEAEAARILQKNLGEKQADEFAQFLRDPSQWTPEQRSIIERGNSLAAAFGDKFPRLFDIEKKLQRTSTDYANMISNNAERAAREFGEAMDESYGDPEALRDLSAGVREGIRKRATDAMERARAGMENVRQAGGRNADPQDASRRVQEIVNAARESAEETERVFWRQAFEQGDPPPEAVTELQGIFDDAISSNRVAAQDFDSGLARAISGEDLGDQRSVQELISIRNKANGLAAKPGIDANLRQMYIDIAESIPDILSRQAPQGGRVDLAREASQYVRELYRGNAPLARLSGENVNELSRGMTHEKLLDNLTGRQGERFMRALLDATPPEGVQRRLMQDVSDEAGEAASQVTIADDIRGNMQRDIEEYIRGMLPAMVKKNARGEDVLNTERLRTWVNDNEEMLRTAGFGERGGLVDEIRNLASDMDLANAARRAQDDWYRNNARFAEFSDSDPVDVVERIARSPRANDEVDELLAQLQQDETGEAIQGLRQAVVDTMIRRGQSGDGYNPERMLRFLKDIGGERRGSKQIFQKIFDEPKAREHLRQTVRAFDQVQRAVDAGQEGAIDLSTNFTGLAALAARVSGANLGGTIARASSAGNIQTPAALAQFMKNLATKIPEKGVQAAIVRAQGDPQFMSYLLTPASHAKTVRQARRHAQRIHAGMVNVIGEEVPPIEELAPELFGEDQAQVEPVRREWQSEELQPGVREVWGDRDLPTPQFKPRPSNPNALRPRDQG